MKISILSLLIITGCTSQSEPVVPTYIYVEPTPAAVVQQPPQLSKVTKEPCWDAATDQFGDWYDMSRNWMHKATEPDCKGKPDARGCK